MTVLVISNCARVDGEEPAARPGQHPRGDLHCFCVDQLSQSTGSKYGGAVQRSEQLAQLAIHKSYCAPARPPCANRGGSDAHENPSGKIDRDSDLIGGLRALAVNHSALVFNNTQQHYIPLFSFVPKRGLQAYVAMALRVRS